MQSLGCTAGGGDHDESDLVPILRLLIVSCGGRKRGDVPESAGRKLLESHTMGPRGGSKHGGSLGGGGQRYFSRKPSESGGRILTSRNGAECSRQRHRGGK